MAKKMRNVALTAKIEVTYGTDPVPTGLANAILCRALAPQPLTAEFADRATVRPFMGASPQVFAAGYSVAEFEIELAGSGAAGTAPAWGPLLRACGISETISAATSVTYAPVSIAHESVTLYYYFDGLMHKMTGCRGTVSFELNAKAIPVMRFRMTGLHNVVTDTAMITATLTGFIAPVAVNKVNTTTFSLHSYAAKVQSFTLDVANQVNYRNLVNNETVDIVDRNPAGAINFEVDTVAAKAWQPIITAGTAGALSIIHGATAGNICTLAASKTQLLSPSYGEQDGIGMLSVPLAFLPTSGNDEFSLVLT